MYKWQTEVFGLILHKIRSYVKWVTFSTQESIKYFDLKMIWDVWNEFMSSSTNFVAYKYYEKNVQYYICSTWRSNSTHDHILWSLFNVIGQSQPLITGFTICEIVHLDDACHGCCWHDNHDIQDHETWLISISNAKLVSWSWLLLHN